LEDLVEVARGRQGAQLLLEYQDKALEMHDRIADAIGEPAAGYWIGTEPRLNGAFSEVEERNPLSRFVTMNVRAVLAPVLEASRDVRWTVVSFRADGDVETYDPAESRPNQRGIAEFLVPTPSYNRVWATAVGRSAMAEIREEYRLSWAIFEQLIGPPSPETIAAARSRLRDAGNR
jgi:hypothetical protein